MSERLRQQLERLVERLHTGYDHLGNSERCPYVYCVHDPQDARAHAFSPRAVDRHGDEEPLFPRKITHGKCWYETLHY